MNSFKPVKVQVVDVAVDVVDPEWRAEVVHIEVAAEDKEVIGRGGEEASGGSGGIAPARGRGRGGHGA
ncbi:hypothetical protein DFQ26_000725, partial [Actinomortierella ambigua]